MNKAKRGWHRMLVAFILIFPPSASNTQDHSFELAVTGVSSHFHPAMSMDHSLGLGGSLGHNVSERLSVLLAVTSLSTSRRYDMVGGTGHIGVDFITVMFEARYLLLELGTVMQIKGSASAGAAHITTDAQTVSLGALGQTVVPGRSEARAAYSAGVVLSHRWDRVTFDVRPSALMITGDAFLNPQYLIAGGISLGL